MDDGNAINDTEYKSGWEKKNCMNRCVQTTTAYVTFERLEAKFNDLTQCNSFLEEEIKVSKK